MSVLNVYCDEVSVHDSNNFIILGALFIEDIDVKRVIDHLENNRCLNKSNHKSGCTVKIPIIGTFKYINQSNIIILISNTCMIFSHDRAGLCS